MKRIVVLLLTSAFLFKVAYSQTTLSEGFEVWPLTNWQLLELGDALDGWRDTFDDNVHTGSKAAYAAIDNAQCDNWMITPPINIVNSEYMLRFWELSGTIDIEYYDSATVLISSGSSNPNDGDFIQLFETGLNTDAFEERVIDLSAYDGQTIYVAFRYQGTYHRWYIDDVTVEPENYIDGNLRQITNPTGVSETPAAAAVMVTMQNTGTSVLTDFAVKWQVNDELQTDANFSDLNIQPGQLLDLNLGSYFFNAEDYYDIKATLVLANDFDPSNDSTESTFEISSFKDGEVIAITPEGIVPNTGNSYIGVEIKNVSENTINTIEIEWQIDEVLQTPFTTTLNLQTGESTVINLGQYTFTTGLHTISATLNALGDINDSNDTYTANVSVGTFFESFEGIEFPPEDWNIDFGVRDGINFGSAADGEFYYVSSVDDNFFGQVSDTIFTPLLDIESDDRFQFYIQSSLATPANHTLVWKNGLTGEINFIQNITPSQGFNNWEPRNFNISAAAGTNYIGIITTSTGSYGEARFDFFTSDASLHLFNNDLKIRNTNINFVAKQNESEQFKCKIRNAGTLPVAGVDYTLKLMEEPGIEVASVSGVDLEPWQETTITVNAVFTEISTKRLYFEILYNADQNLDNNVFRSTTVGVVPNNVIINEIGSPDIRNANIPFTPNGNTNTLGEDDLSQSLYYADEFTSAGYVHGIAYKYDNLLEAREVKNYPLKVWITQTNIDSLTDGWVSQNDLILVFDGVVDILPGNGRDLYIPFNEPVLINGIDNVIIQNYQYDPVWPPAIFRMFSTNLGINNTTRSLGVFDVFGLNPSNPPDFFATLVDIPYTRFVIEPVISTTVLSGVVYNNDDNFPIANSTLSIFGSSQTVVTDLTGTYTFPELQYGTYTINIAADGFQDLSTQVELNTENQVQDFFLNPLEELQVKGRVFGDNDISSPLAFVEVLILQEGSSFEQTISDENGDFTFPLIYGGLDYELRLKLYGYKEKIIQISPVNINIDLGDIIMEEEFISPFDVQVVEDIDPTVTWKSPKFSSKGKLQHDANVVSSSYTNEPYENVWLGNYYLLEERTTITSVEIQTDIYPNAEDYVTIDIFDLASDEILASSEPFIIYADSIQTIDVPNIVVSDSIALMVHWENNSASTNALAVDFSTEELFNGAVIKQPGQQINLLSNFFGGGAPNMAFHIRANTLEAGNPVTNGETVSYNIYRGLASEFPEISSWGLLNSTPVLDLSFIDTNSTNISPNELYRYAVETIYTNGISEVTFSNVILRTSLSFSELQYINSKIHVYPVPTKEILNIELDPGLSIDNYIEIYNMAGKRVRLIEPLVFQNNKAVIDLKALQSGMYLLSINFPKGRITKKFQVN
jgi:hypothetical protein